MSDSNDSLSSSDESDPDDYYYIEQGYPEKALSSGSVYEPGQRDPEKALSSGSVYGPGQRDPERALSSGSVYGPGQRDPERTLSSGSVYGQGRVKLSKRQQEKLRKQKKMRKRKKAKKKRRRKRRKKKKNGCCQVLVGSLTLDWYIMVPLLGVYLAYVGVAIQTVHRQYTIITYHQCPMNIQALSKVEKSYWGEWTEYTECTVPCGNGVRSRSRTCILSSLKDAAECEGEDSETSGCPENVACPFALVSSWTEWTNFTLCSVTCGRGESTRSRMCTFSTGAEASDCEGENKETTECSGTTKNCPITGGWSIWSLWTSCSQTCGEGDKFRKRECSDPKPMWGGADCEGSDKETTSCSLAVCSVSTWSMWSEYTECSVTCGNGTKSRSRICHPGQVATNCPGDANELSPCIGTVQPNCAINGGWTEWSSWGDCSVTCGVGVRRASHKCENPKPQYGGEYCQGSNETSSTCTKSPCVVHGGWTDWSSWKDCSVTCGNGVKRKNRKCENPEPEFGGDFCEGPSEKTSTCSQRTCPINGGWTKWSSWTKCSVTCGDGVKKRKRKCEKPKPQHGGKNCKGSKEKTSTCSKSACIGNWKQWKSWGSCKQKFCKGGVRKRERKCDPSNCAGSSSETKGCVAGCPTMGLNGYFVEAKHGIKDGNQRSQQHAFISMYMRIPYNATVNKAFLWTLAKRHPFYISFWTPTKDFKSKSIEKFYLKMKFRVVTQSTGLQTIVIKKCVEKGWYVGFHYDANGRSRWKSDNNGVIGYKKFQFSQSSPYVSYVSRKYDSNWAIGMKRDFAKATDNICPALILKLKCIGCHYVHLNSYFHHPTAMNILPKVNDKDSMPRLTIVFMHMKFSQDGHIFQLKYVSRIGGKHVFLHFYEPVGSSTDYPSKKKFVLKKIRSFTTPRSGVCKLNAEYTFKKGWILGISYRWHHSGRPNHDSYSKAVILWKDLPNSFGNYFANYFTNDMDKDWKTGRKVEMKKGTVLKALAVIANIKYDC